MGSWKGRGNQYIQFIRVLYCKLLTNGKQLPAFPLEAVPGTEPRPQRWEERVLLLCHPGPCNICELWVRQTFYKSMSTVQNQLLISIFFSSVPSFDKDFLLMIQDWEEISSVPRYHASIYDFRGYLKNGFDAETCDEYPTATVINGIGEESIIFIIIIMFTQWFFFWFFLRGGEGYSFVCSSVFDNFGGEDLNTLWIHINNQILNGPISNIF